MNKELAHILRKRAILSARLHYIIRRITLDMRFPEIGDSLYERGTARLRLMYPLPTRDLDPGEIAYVARHHYEESQRLEDSHTSPERNT